MSYGIIRVQKFKASGVRGIQSHDLREREPRTNPDIDPTRKTDNYYLVECPVFNQAIRERLESLENKKAIRKDAVVMCQFLVTSDNDFFQSMHLEKQRKFFQQSLDFIRDRYGQGNIISATVHMDEKTPHMHVNITPIREGRLTAKDIFNRTELSQLHTEFHQKVGKIWGLKRGESREKKRKHLETEAFKHKTVIESMAKELEQLKAEKNQAIKDMENAQGLRDGTQKALQDARERALAKAKEEEQRRELEREKQPSRSHGPRMRM